MGEEGEILNISNKNNLLEEIRYSSNFKVARRHSDRIRIEFAEPNKIRSRKVISRSNHRVTYKHPSHKTGRMNHAESLIERDAFILLDVLPDVINYSEQPALITYVANGVAHKHYPDLLVKYRNHFEFIEVKTDDEADSFEIIERTNILKELLLPKGYGYNVLRESDIRNEPRFSNASYILRRGYCDLEIGNSNHIDEKLKSKNGLPWGSVINESIGVIAVNYVCNLILKGLISIKLNEELTADTALFFHKTGGV